MDDLEAMVYSVEWRRRVLKSSLLGYRRILDKARLGKTQRNWLGHEKCLKRRVQKLFGKSTCFNQGNWDRGENPECQRTKIYVGRRKASKVCNVCPLYSQRRIKEAPAGEGESPDWIWVNKVHRKIRKDNPEFTG